MRQRLFLGIILTLTALLVSCTNAEQPQVTTDSAPVETKAPLDSATGEDTTAQQPTATAADYARDAMAHGTYPETLSEMKASKIATTYSVDADKIADAAAFFAGSGAYPDEIVLVMTNSSADAAAVKTAFETYLAAQTASWSDYRPEQVPKLENAIIRQYDNAVVYCVCDNAADVAAAFDNLF